MDAVEPGSVGKPGPGRCERHASVRMAHGVDETGWVVQGGGRCLERQPDGGASTSDESAHTPSVLASLAYRF